MIPSIRESERWVAGFKSESRPAWDRNRWPASYWNAWPASSESALYAVGGILYVGLLPFLFGGVIWVFLTFFAALVIAGYYAPRENP